MPLIQKGSMPITFINVFTVAPEKIDDLVAHQVKDLHAFIKFTPGLISSSWHRSLDNTRVTNYAQWESIEAFKAAVADPAFQKHSAEAESLSISHDSHFYEVVTTSDDET